jgi:hypothetical protein
LAAVERRKRMGEREREREREQSRMHGGRIECSTKRIKKNELTVVNREPIGYYESSQREEMRSREGEGGRMLGSGAKAKA